MSDDIKARLRDRETRKEFDDWGIMSEAADRIESLEIAIATHGAEACGILRSYHQEDGTRLWLALRAALAQDNPTRDQGAGDQAADAE